MFGEIGTAPGAGGSTARDAALAHMKKALASLDSDEAIPPMVAAHLQMAIDALEELNPKTEVRG